jgi:hypothetical protein
MYGSLRIQGGTSLRCVVAMMDCLESEFIIVKAKELVDPEFLRKGLCKQSACDVWKYWSKNLKVVRNTR